MMGDNASLAVLMADGNEMQLPGQREAKGRYRDSHMFVIGRDRDSRMD